MAENKPWCFNLDSPFSELKNVQDAYKAKIEERHAKVSEQEWEDIVSDLDLGSYEFLAEFENKPKFATQGSWWTLSENVNISVARGVDVGTGPTVAISPWQAEREFLLEIGGDVVGVQAINKALLELVTYFPQKWGQEIAEENILLTDVNKESRDAIIESLDELRTKMKDGSFSHESLYDSRDSIKASANDLYDAGAAPEQFWKLFGNLEIAITEIQAGLERLSKCKDESHFEQAYTNAIIALSLAKLATEAQINTIKSDANRVIAYSSPLGLANQIINGDLFELEDLDKLKKKIQDKIKQEVKEAFADNLIFSEQCFMLTNILQLIEKRKGESLPFPLPYSTHKDDKEACGSSATAFSSNLNQPLLLQAEPFSFVNKLAVEPTQEALFDIMPHELSSLTPNIELFKVTTEEFDGQLMEVEVPIRFDINTKSSKIKDVYKSQRGTGVGLKSFKFSYDGTDPFSAKKAITADLSIFASSFSDLLEMRGSEISKASYRYTDLALKTGTNDKSLTETERENTDKLNFRLKVVVQWASSIENIRSIKRQEIKKALYDSAITLYLTPVIHTFDFDDTGAVTFNISYQAYIEDFFTNDNFDVFSKLIAVRETRKYVLEYFKEQACDVLGSEDFKSFQKADSSFIINNNNKVLNSIIDGLHNRDNIHYLNMTYQQIEKWMKNPMDYVGEKVPISKSASTGNTSDIVNEAIKASADTQDEEGNIDFGDLRASLVANSQENQNIAFFYLSDLISVVMNSIEEQLIVFDDTALIYDQYVNLVTQNIKEKKADIKSYLTEKFSKEIKKKKFANIEQFRKIRIVLGPLEMSNTADPKRNNILSTIGDLPISLNYFVDFLSDKVIARNLTHYPISKFIKDLINDLVKNFINSEDCAGANTSQRLSINSTTMVGYNNEHGIDTITQIAKENLNSTIFKKGVLFVDQIEKTLPEKFPLIKISGDRGNPNTSKDISMMTNFYVFSVGRSYPSDKYVGNRATDSSNGVFHYLLGQDRGIVKNIKLQKTNTPGLKEVRFEQEGYAGLEQLREVYNASIDCYLNPQTFPGTYIYIPPEGFSPEFTKVDPTLDLTKFGIGGYFMITKTTHQIGPGTGDTSIEATWVASKDGKYGKKDLGPQKDKRGEGEGSERVSKCLISSRSS